MRLRFGLILNSAPDVQRCQRELKHYQRVSAVGDSPDNPKDVTKEE